jgi:hypothetical protein
VYDLRVTIRDTDLSHSRSHLVEFHMTERILDIIGELAGALPFLIFVAFGFGRPILRKLTGAEPESRPGANPDPRDDANG